MVAQPGLPLLQRQFLASRRGLKPFFPPSIQWEKEIREFGDGPPGFLGAEAKRGGRGHQEQYYRTRYKHDVNAPDYGDKWLHPQVKANIKDSPELQAILDTEYELLGKLRNRLCSEIFSDGETKQHIPINLPRVLEVAQSKSPTRFCVSQFFDLGPRV